MPLCLFALLAADYVVKLRKTNSVMLGLTGRLWLGHRHFFLAKIGNKLQNMGHVVQSFVTFAFQMVDPK